MQGRCNGSVTDSVELAGLQLNPPIPPVGALRKPEQCVIVIDGSLFAFEGVLGGAWLDNILIALQPQLSGQQTAESEPIEVCGVRFDDLPFSVSLGLVLSPSLPRHKHCHAVGSVAVLHGHWKRFCSIVCRHEKNK